MKHLPLLLLFALLASCAREVSKDKLVERDRITYEILSTEPYNGSAYTEFRELGQFENGSYRDGRKEGPWEYPDENGKLSSKKTYSDDKLISEEKF